MDAIKYENYNRCNISKTTELNGFLSFVHNGFLSFVHNGFLYAELPLYSGKPFISSPYTYLHFALISLRSDAESLSVL
jgi:hypothetical protein